MGGIDRKSQVVVLLLEQRGASRAVSSQHL